MKRVICSSNINSDDLIDRLSEMSTSEIHKDKEAIKYCYELQAELSDVVSNLSPDLGGLDDMTSEINNINDQLHFRCTGLVYTNSKKLVNQICDALTNYINTETPFNDKSYVSYFEEGPYGPYRGYRINIYGSKYINDDFWFS